MNFIKKQSISTWLCLASFIIGVVGIILYGANATTGYFAGVIVSPLVVSSIFALLALAAIMVLAQFKFSGLIGKAINVVTDILKIIVPMLFMICVLSFLSSRMEGLAYILGSNEEILATIQTPTNMSSVNSAIAGFIIFGVAAITAIVAAFFRTTKKSEASV